MGKIKEPVEADLNIGFIPYTDEDREAVSAIITHYKKTGQVLKTEPKRRQQKKKKTGVAKMPSKKISTASVTAI